MFKNKVKKLKTDDDIDSANKELYDKWVEHVNQKYLEGDTFKERELNEIRFRFGRISHYDYELIKNKLSDDDEFEKEKKRLDIDFSHQKIGFREYQKQRIELDKEKTLQNINVEESNLSSVNLNKSITENIESEYLRNMNELKFRFSEVDYIEYEIEKNNINKEPFVRVYLEPHDKLTNSSELVVDVRHNALFIEHLEKQEQYEKQYDDETGELDVGYLIEQWLHTNIIVLAANMLKETDLDFFRSVDSDDENSVSIIENVQFDTSEMSEEDAQKAREMTDNRRFYK